MPKSQKHTRLASAAGLLGLLVLGALGLFLGLFLDLDAYKPRLEAAASQALGMEVDIGGRLGIGFSPGLRLTLEDVRLRNRGAVLASAKRVRIGIELLPLLRSQVRISAVILEQARIDLARDPDGRFNFEKPATAGGPLPAVNLPRLSLADASLRYQDQRAGQGFEASHCHLEVNDLGLARRPRQGGMQTLLRHLSLAAELACGELRAQRHAAADLRLKLAGAHGVFALQPITMSVFGGQGSGDIQADFSGAEPAYRVRYALTRFRIEAFLATLSPQKVATGAMDVALELSLRGKDVEALRRSAQGRIALRGRQLILHGRDLDRDFARFESSQNFNLVDLGAYLFTGPFGVAVTKGYDFARILHGSGGRSEIPVLVSDWNIGQGMARARDVAMATRANRVALQGSLDLVHRRFAGVTLALIDARGCAKVRQGIRGTFQKPVIEPPSTLKALSGPVLQLFARVQRLLPGGKCEVFYAGSVAPPK